MRAAYDQMYRLVDDALGCLDDLFDRRVTAADDQNNSVRGIDRQRDFLHLQVGAPGAVQQDEMKTGRHLGRLRYPGEVGSGPRGAEAKRVRRLSVEVPHVGGERIVAPVKVAWQRRTKDAEVFLR